LGIVVSRPKSLPDFAKPPLDEVVLSIQFADLPLQNHHAGLMWLKVRDKYPNVQEQAPIDATFETFGVPMPAPQEPRRPQAPEIRFMPAEAMIRYWFISADGRQLLQMQRDRFIQNWRTREPQDEYPRFEPLRASFESEISIFQDFLKEYDIGEIRCNQCEVTYINAIGPTEEIEDPNRELDKIFTIWCERYSGEGLGPIERARFTASFLMPAETGEEPHGRLHINAAPGLRQRDSMPVVRLSVTARGKPKDESVAAALDWIDLGRVFVVRGFAAITTEKMHTFWGRKDTQ
jgi:uncharacterized protein (TIGR04255 family)